MSDFDDDGFDWGDADPNAGSEGGCGIGCLYIVSFLIFLGVIIYYIIKNIIYPMIK